MFYDALTVAAVCDELQQKILGGWVQRVLRLSEHSLGCEIYANHQRHWLLVSAHPQHARVHLSQEKLARGSEDVTPLLLLLRKHFRDGQLIAINQPALERVLVLTVSKRAEDQAGGIEQCQIIIEVMGRYSNIILADSQGMVLDSLKRVSPQVNRYRVVLPQHPYVPPPPQQKMPPANLAPELLDQALRARGPESSIWQGLVATVAAMSPLLAREIVFRAAGDANVTTTALAEPGLIERLLETLHEMYGGLVDHAWSPSIAGKEGVAVAFAPYLLSHLATPQPCGSISRAIEAYYGELEQLTAGEQQKRQVRVQLEEVRQRHGRRKEALERSLAQGQAADRLRRSGEAIFAAVSGMRPGQQRLEVGDLSVVLDPQRSAVENAQAYFREYKKAKGALQRVPEMLANETAALSYLDDVAAHLELAATVDDVRRVAGDLRVAALGGAAAQPVPQKKAKGKQRAGKPAGRGERAGPPPYRVLPGGYEVYVGRSARQNEEVTFRTVGPEDLWLHARGVPGAHVVIKARGREIPEPVIVAAAQLAAVFSQARDSGRVAVDCTQRKHVRRAHVGLPGLVNYGQERTLYVAPAQGG